ncbi:hypothetical protein AAHH78_37295, partial [Burkholderia pseudomallei]
VGKSGAILHHSRGQEIANVWDTNKNEKMLRNSLQHIPVHCAAANQSMQGIMRILPRIIF